MQRAKGHTKDVIKEAAGKKEAKTHLSWYIAIVKHHPYKHDKGEQEIDTPGLIPLQ